MDQRTNQSISDFIGTVRKQYANLNTAYLFGSYATQRDRAESDIDIALIFKNLSESQRFDLQVQLMLLASEFDIRIEPHPIAEKDFHYNNPFAAEIIKGIEINPKAPEKWAEAPLTTA